MQAFLDANLTAEVQKVLLSIQHLLVTEAHRVQHTMWTVLDAAFQRAKGNTCKWGGAQLVLEGDFLQLTEGGEEPGKGPLFAQADFHNHFKVIYLDQQQRSHGDLQALLGVLAMRCSFMHSQVQGRLRSLARPLPPDVAATAVHLFGKVAPCRAFNEENNQQLQGPTVTYKGTDSLGASDTRSLQAAQAALDASTNLLSAPLHLKVGHSTDSPVPWGWASLSAFPEPTILSQVCIAGGVKSDPAHQRAVAQASRPECRILGHSGEASEAPGRAVQKGQERAAEQLVDRPRRSGAGPGVCAHH